MRTADKGTGLSVATGLFFVPRRSGLLVGGIIVNSTISCQSCHSSLRTGVLVLGQLSSQSQAEPKYSATKSPDASISSYPAQVHPGT